MSNNSVLLLDDSFSIYHPLKQDMERSEARKYYRNLMRKFLEETDRNDINANNFDAFMEKIENDEDKKVTKDLKIALVCVISVFLFFTLLVMLDSKYFHVMQSFTDWAINKTK